MCFKNAANCLVGNDMYTEEDLLSIGEKICDELGLSSDVLGLYDDTGNFTVDYARIFLMQEAGINLEDYHHKIDANKYNAYLVLHKYDWYAVRCCKETWWNLSSMNPKPIAIADVNIYLDGLLADKAKVWCCVPVPQKVGGAGET